MRKIADCAIIRIIMGECWKEVNSLLKVTLLGTGGTQPLPERALAAAAVTVGGRSVLLDCG